MKNLRLIEAMNTHNVRQKDLAELMHCSEGYISRLVNHKVRHNRKFKRRVARIFGKEYEDLF